LRYNPDRDEPAEIRPQSRYGGEPNSTIWIMKNLITSATSCLILAFLSPGMLSPAQGTPSYVPNTKLTPGSVREVTKDDLCESKYRSYDSAVSVSVKSKVFDLYSINTELGIAYNIDHLIPVTLGGTNAVQNLWPQPLAGEWNYMKKNSLERRLYKLVCSGELELQKAQQEIAGDWIVAYRKYVVESEGRR
jgi:hypothetical protein